MRILNAALCSDDKDPKGIGRIRFKPYGEYISEKERSVEYVEWDNNDPFIAIPFLPLHINVIPQIGQAVRLLVYDTEKNQRNVEYIPGPYTSSFDLENQTFLQQMRDTTYSGNIVKDIKDIYSKNGKLVNEKSEGTVIKIGDVGVKGNYGSDIIFTQNGVQIRGGFLPDKSSPEYQQIVKTRNLPILSNKMSRFTLKKFQTTKVLEIIDEPISSIQVETIKYILEYEIIYDQSTPNTVNFYLYKVVSNYGNVFLTDTFNNDVDIHSDNIKSSLKLINSQDDDSTPTHYVNVDLSTTHLEIRSLINKLLSNDDTISWSSIFNNIGTNNLGFSNTLFPLYFKQRKNFPSIANSVNNTIVTQINFKKNGSNDRIGYGLFFSKTSYDPKEITKNVEKTVLKNITSTNEQSFSSLSADKIFIISTTTNGYESNKKVNFDTLNKYELTQDDYLLNIEPNTYSLVRGEVLLNVLRAFYDAFDSHIHQINKKPIVGTDPARKKLDDAMKEIEVQLINNSIKIN